MHARNSPNVKPILIPVSTIVQAFDTCQEFVFAIRLILMSNLRPDLDKVTSDVLQRVCSFLFILVYSSCTHFAVSPGRGEVNHHTVLCLRARHLGSGPRRCVAAGRRIYMLLLDGTSLVVRWYFVRWYSEAQASATEARARCDGLARALAARPESAAAREAHLCHHCPCRV